MSATSAAVASFIVGGLFSAIFVLLLVTLILTSIWIKDGSITATHADAAFGLNVSSATLVTVGAIILSVVAAFPTLFITQLNA